MRRRSILQYTLGGLVIVAWPPDARCWPGLRDDRPIRAEPIEESLACLFSDRELAVAMGRRCLACLPGRVEPDLLLERSGLGLLRKHPRLDAALLRRALDERRRRDFLAGDTVAVDGWVLAQSEACLCALLALST